MVENGNAREQLIDELWRRQPQNGTCTEENEDLFRETARLMIRNVERKMTNLLSRAVGTTTNSRDELKTNAFYIEEYSLHSFSEKCLEIFPETTPKCPVRKVVPGAHRQAIRIYHRDIIDDMLDLKSSFLLDALVSKHKLEASDARSIIGQSNKRTRTDALLKQLPLIFQAEEFLDEFIPLMHDYCHSKETVENIEKAMFDVCPEMSLCFFCQVRDLVDPKLLADELYSREAISLMFQNDLRASALPSNMKWDRLVSEVKPASILDCLKKKCPALYEEFRMSDVTEFACCCDAMTITIADQSSAEDSCAPSDIARLTDLESCAGTTDSTPDNSCTFFGGKSKISVCSDKLANVEADVLVNTLSWNLILDSGTVSNSLVKAAGGEIQEECNRKYPKGIKPGQIAQTGPGRLQTCKTIFHGSRSFNMCQTIFVKCLETYVKNCLQTASDQGFKTIAFPALGTGRLGYPADLVARIMFDCVDTTQTNLDSVMFVICPKDRNILQYFQAELLRTRDSNSDVLQTFGLPEMERLRVYTQLFKQKYSCSSAHSLGRGTIHFSSFDSMKKGSGSDAVKQILIMSKNMTLGLQIFVPGKSPVKVLKYLQKKIKAQRHLEKLQVVSLVMTDEDLFHKALLKVDIGPAQYIKGPKY